jgi:hypothetical protein
MAGIFLTAPFLAQAEPSPVAGESARALEALRRRIDLERAREEDLRSQQTEVESLKLELEKKKALESLGRNDGEGALASVPAQTREGVAPVAAQVILLKALFVGGGRKEAWVDVNGAVRRVVEGDPCAGAVVRMIDVDGILLAREGSADQRLSPGR